MTGRVALVIAQVIRQLRLQRGLQHPAGDPGQQTTRADQLHPIGLRLFQLAVDDADGVDVKA